MRTISPGAAAGANRRIDAVALIVLGALGVILAVMFARVVQLQVAPPEGLRAHMGDRTSTIVEPGRRGDLLDRRGRILAASRFGQRLFVDPTKFRSPPDADVLTLADAAGLPVEEVGKPIVAAMAKNQALAAAKAAGVTPTVPGAAEGEEASEAKPVRYVGLGGVLEDWRIEHIKKLKIPGVFFETRSVREVSAENEAAAILGKVGFEQKGLMGAELMLDPRMQPKNGHLEFVRDSQGRPLWVDPGEYVPPQRGQDIRLSIDLELQRILHEEVQRGAEEADAQGARAVMLDPATGEIVAMVDIIRKVADAVPYDWKTLIAKDKKWGGGDWGPRYITINPDPKRAEHPALGRNRCVEDLYEPGSTFKPFMWSACTELGLARPEEVFDTGGGHWTTPYGRHLSDVVKKDHQTWQEVLINSSNIGMVKATSRMTFPQMHDAVLKFGFGKLAGTGLPGESPGLVTAMSKWTKYSQTSVAIGHEVAVTPVQMVRAFSVFARMDELAGTMPPVRFLAAGDTTPEVRVTKRIIPRSVAELARETMRGVTANLDRKLSQRHPPEKGWRYELFGKSGTAEIPMTNPPPGARRPKGSDGYFRGQYNSSFIAAGPVEHPRLVCVVVMDDPGPELVRTRNHYGSLVSGPVVRRAMDRALSYLGVPASLTPEGQHRDQPQAD